MKLFILLLLSLLLLFSSCVSTPHPVSNEVQSVPEASSEVLRVQHFSPQKEEYYESEKREEKEESPAAYRRKKDMTAEEIVEAYFEQQYLSYTTFKDVDLSEIIDKRSKNNQNMVRWLKMLTQRRKLIAENNFCYIETEAFSYTISFEQEVSDQRMDIWEKWISDPQNMVVHFSIKGEGGKAYPPIMALNSQHSMLLKQVNGEWKISMHYFPGSRRKYGVGTVTVPTESEMLADLELEFEQRTQAEPAQIPSGAREYDAEAAVDYAEKYTEIKNPDFYDIGDWVGNCANFVSQSVWTGFGADRMTSEWYDGSPAWHHVGYFWEYIMSGNGLGGQELGGVSELKNGDIIQTRSMSMVDEPDRFTHELLVVDEETLMLAQNTPASFVYYSDLVNVQTRIVRPVYLK